VAAGSGVCGQTGDASTISMELTSGMFAKSELPHNTLVRQAQSLLFERGRDPQPSAAGLSFIRCRGACRLARLNATVTDASDPKATCAYATPLPQRIAGNLRSCIAQGVAWSDRESEVVLKLEMAS
jgi:hypothetical protein